MPYKKILIIGPFPPVVNGVTVSNDFLYKELSARGYQVSKINTETGKIASLQGDKVSIIKILTFLSIYTSLFRIMGKDKVYMTVAQTFWGLVKYAPFMWYCKLLGIPYILHIHGGYLCKAYLKMNKRKQGIIKRLINGGASVIALSDSLGEEMKSVFPEANVQIVENFYEAKLIDPALQRTLHTVPHFLFLSNLMLGKGILDFLDALILLQDEKKLDFKVALAGNIEKGMHAEIQRRITQLNGKVYFFGLAHFTRKKQLLYWSDIFVLPTWYIMEGQPLSIIEAYVTGNIVVSTHQGGIKDISDYHTFFKVPPMQVAILAETLLETIKQLQDLKEEIHTTSIATQKRFNPHNFLNKIEEILLH